MVPITEYMRQPRESRRIHLQLNTPCDEIGMKYSYHAIALLAYSLGTSIPKKGDNALVCHGCNNSNCSNVNHLYWGTYKDNHLDQKDAGTWKSAYQRTVEKYGSEETLAILKENGEKLSDTKLVCPHCQKEGSGNLMYIKHFNNCKHIALKSTGSDTTL